MFRSRLTASVQVLRRLVLAWAAFVAAPVPAIAMTPVPPARLRDQPNIVLILADDLGIGEIGPYGQREIRTPNLDQMSREGTRFTQFYAGSCVCAPSRCTLMTGLHSGHARIADNDAGALRAADVTIAEILKESGYVTAFFGKWGLSKESRPESWPTRQGFDVFFGYRDQTHAHNPWPEFLISGEARVALANKVPGAGPEGAGVASERRVFAPDRILDEALAFVSSHRTQPFFLCFAPTLPHINNEAVGRPDGGFEVPGLGEYATKPWPLAKKSYAASVSALDAEVGRLRALLREMNMTNRSVVIFTSDNGPTALRSANDGTTDVIGRWFAGKDPLAGFKHDLREGGIRVPLIVVGPDTHSVVRPGAVDRTPAYFPDLLPTLADYAGHKPVTGLDGVSLRALIDDGALPAPARSLYWGYPDRDQHAVRSENWKAYWIDGHASLFDLDSDPREERDVSALHADLLARLDAIRRKEMRAK